MSSTLTRSVPAAARCASAACRCQGRSGPPRASDRACMYRYAVRAPTASAASCRPSSTRCGANQSSAASLLLAGSPSAPLAIDDRAAAGGCDRGQLPGHRERGAAAAGQPGGRELSIRAAPRTRARPCRRRCATRSRPGSSTSAPATPRAMAGSSRGRLGSPGAAAWPAAAWPAAALAGVGATGFTAHLPR